MKTIKKQDGFTLAETMLSMLILLLVSMIVANGVPVAKSAYEKVVVSANAKILLSTTIATLRDELTTARDIEVESGNKSIIYFNADRGTTSKIYFETGEGTVKKIKIQDYIQRDLVSRSFIDDDTASDNYKKEKTTRNLLTDAASNGNLYITYDSIEYDKVESIVTIKKLAVYNNSDTEKKHPLASIGDLDKNDDPSNNLNIRIIIKKKDS